MLVSDDPVPSTVMLLEDPEMPMLVESVDVTVAPLLIVRLLPLLTLPTWSAPAMSLLPGSVTRAQLFEEVVSTSEFFWRSVPIIVAKECNSPPFFTTREMPLFLFPTVTVRGPPNSLGAMASTR